MSAAARRAVLAGLLARLLALPLFGSSFAQDLFVPFLDYGATHPGHNPWAALDAHHFPYGGALYLLLLTPRLVAHALLGAAALGPGPLGIALLKLPLLGMDAWLLWQLLRLAPRRELQVVRLYWLNPVLFFITYVHGQLDVAATALLLAGLCALLRDRHAVAATLLGLATLCKAHVLAVLPLVAAYVWKRDFTRPALRHLAQGAACFVGVCLLGFAPHLAAGALPYVTAASPEALQVFSAQLVLGGERTLYVGLALVLAVLGRLCIATRISDTALLFGAAAVCGTLTLVTPAMPGWYFWTVPYFALLYANYVGPSRLLLGAFVGLYLAYFAALQGSRTAPTFWREIVFTLLQTSFAALLVAMWQATLRRGAPLRGRVRPLLVGIAGDSASGKDTLTAAMAALFDSRATAVVQGDDYHKWERGHARWQDYTHLHPRANHLEALAQHTEHLTAGRLIFHPHYDHGSGTFTAPRALRGSRLVIVQGLHALYLRGMRRQLDLKIFLAPHPLVRLAWKLGRDVRLRGHSVDRVVESIEARVADFDRHIGPQRALADWTIEVLPCEAVTTAEVMAGHLPALWVRHTVWNDTPVGGLAQALAALPGCRVGVDVAVGDINRVALEVRGAPGHAAIEAVAAQLFPRLRPLTRSRRAPRWRAGYEGVAQLLALAHLDAGGAHASPDSTSRQHA